ncbi:MAG: metallophosphoesterase [Promethearchaeota archaeon]|nr:MAG: metallophosphoesterase [Candidatus Lokiarchaeota archaeon]
MLKCMFVSDLHGIRTRYDKLFKIIKKQKPNGVFIGGDLLPGGFGINVDIEKFLQDFLLSKVSKLKQSGNEIRFFTILGNDDPRIYESILKDAEKNNLIEYVHNHYVSFGDFFVTGYSYVPPTPFKLKDWEKYDVSRYVDVGATSPEEGYRTTKTTKDEIRYSTITEDLKILSKNVPVEKTIFLFHSPPYNSDLDRANLDNKKFNHTPIDVHVGSIAIQRFIAEKQPLLTLHGHVHESTRITGHWKQKFGRTFSFNAAHDGPELALIRFDIDKLENAIRILI